MRGFVDVNGERAKEEREGREGAVRFWKVLARMRVDDVPFRRAILKGYESVGFAGRGV